MLMSDNMAAMGAQSVIIAGLTYLNVIGTSPIQHLATGLGLIVISVMLFFRERAKNIAELEIVQQYELIGDDLADK